LILHRRAARLLEELDRTGRLSASLVASATASHPRFQNIDYPLAMPPLLIDAGALAELAELAQSYVALLEKVVRLYRSNADIRRFLDLGSAAEELIDAEGDVERAIAVCRLDGYVDRGSGRLRILENNADSPAGTLFTPRLNRLTRELIGDALRAPSLLPMDESDPFLDLLLDLAPPAARGRQRLRTAVLQLHGNANRESQEVAAALRARGHDSEVVDPRDLAMTADGLATREGPLDVVWNKINTSVWNALVAEAPELVGTLARAARHETGPTMLNSYGARHVAEAKTSLALLHDPRFGGLFSPQERALIERLVPWTAKLERDSAVDYEGRSWPLEKLLVERQNDLVLKERYDIRGDGVTIGRAESAAHWREKIASSWANGTSVQRHVEPAQYEVRLVGSEESSLLNVSLDSFVFRGRLVGLGAKASRRHKVNLFQGGSKLCVIAVPDE
jgi:hypothetical protein